MQETFLEIAECHPSHSPSLLSPKTRELHNFPPLSPPTWRRGEKCISVAAERKGERRKGRRKKLPPPPPPTIAGCGGGGGGHPLERIVHDDTRMCSLVCVVRRAGKTASQRFLAWFSKKRGKSKVYPKKNE